MKSDENDQPVPVSCSSKKRPEVSSNGVVRSQKRVVMTVMESTMAKSAVTRAITPTAVANHPTTAMTMPTQDADADGLQNKTEIKVAARLEKDDGTKNNDDEAQSKLS